MFVNVSLKHLLLQAIYANNDCVSAFLLFLTYFEIFVKLTLILSSEVCYFLSATMGSPLWYVGSREGQKIAKA